MPDHIDFYPCILYHLLPFLSLFMVSLHFLQVSQGILFQRATDCLSQLGQTTCMLFWNTPSQSCGLSPCACGYGLQKEVLVRPCHMQFLTNQMNWCCCKACIPPLSCSSMTRYVSTKRLLCICTKLSTACLQLIFPRAFISWPRGHIIWIKFLKCCITILNY